MLIYIYMLYNEHKQCSVHTATVHSAAGNFLIGAVCKDEAEYDRDMDRM